MLELLVSLGIITMLIGLFVANYRGGSQKSELSLNAQKLVSDLRLVQNSSLGSARFDGRVPDGGWGIHFSKVDGSNDFYTVFADVDGDHDYDAPGESQEAFGGRRIALPENIRISELLFDSTPKDELDVIFVPPDPETIIWDGFSSTTNAVVRLRHSVTGTTRDVFVNFFGLIEAQ